MLEHPDEDEAREILDEALEGQDDPQLQRLMEIFFRRDSVPEGLRVIPLNVPIRSSGRGFSHALGTPGGSRTGSKPLGRVDTAQRRHTSWYDDDCARRYILSYSTRLPSTPGTYSEAPIPAITLIASVRSA